MTHDEKWMRAITCCIAMIGMCWIITVLVIDVPRSVLQTAFSSGMRSMPLRSHNTIQAPHTVQSFELPNWTVHRAEIDENPAQILQGKTVLFELVPTFKRSNCTESEHDLTLHFNEHFYEIFCYGDKYYSLIGIDVAQETGIYGMELMVNEEVHDRIAVPVIADEFSRRFRGQTSIHSSELPQRKQERERRERLIHKAWNTYTIAVDFSHSDIVYPLDYIYQTSPFGQHRIYIVRDPERKQVIRIHYGVDLRARSPQPLRAIFDGFIIDTGYYLGWGNYTAIYHGHGIVTQMLHQSRVFDFVKPGAYVKAGKIIGETGNTGGNYPFHLHFRVRIYDAYVDPLQFIQLMNSLTVESYHPDITSFDPEN